MDKPVPINEPPDEALTSNQLDALREWARKSQIINNFFTLASEVCDLGSGEATLKLPENPNTWDWCRLWHATLYEHAEEARAAAPDFGVEIQP